LPDIFVDETKARDTRIKVNLYIENSLKANTTLKRSDQPFRRKDKDDRNKRPRHNNKTNHPRSNRQSSRSRNKKHHSMG